MMQNGGLNEGYAEEAFRWNRGMLISDLSTYSGKKVRIYKGKQDKDSYKRSLRYVTIVVNDPVSNKSYELPINDQLIKHGFAINLEQYKDQQNSKIYQDFVNSEKEAKTISLYLTNRLPLLLQLNQRKDLFLVFRVELWLALTL